jgi:hypothetical protein
VREVSYPPQALTVHFRLGNLDRPDSFVSYSHDSADSSDMKLRKGSMDLFRRPLEQLARQEELV